MSSRPRLIKVLIAGLCAVFFPVIQSPAAVANTCTSYSVGYQGPLSGPESALGTTQLDAVRFALTKFKAANSSTTVSSIVVTADDQGDPTLSAAAANSLINNPCVVAVVGPAYSGASRVALPLYEAAGLAVITPSAVNETLSKYGQASFHRAARLQKDTNLDLMRDIADVSPGATLAYFYSEDYYSPNWISSGFSGIKVISQSLTTEDRSENRIRIRSEYDAGARYFLYDGYVNRQNIQEFAEDVKTISSSNRIIFSSSIEPTDVKEFYTTSLNGSWFYPISLSFPVLNPTLATEFLTAYPGSSKAYATEAFDAGYFFFQAIAAGSDTRQKVNTFVSTKKFAGLAGNLEFRSDGDRDNYRTPQIVLSSGNLSITNAVALGINGGYQVVNRVSTPNFKLSVLNWDDSPTTSKRIVRYQNHTQSFLSSQTSNIALPNGETIIEILPDEDFQDALKRRLILKVTVTAGVVTSVADVTAPASPVSYSINGDTYTIKLIGFNFTATILDSGSFAKSTAVISEVSGSVVTSLYKIPITSSNKILANLDISKTYRVEIYTGASRYQYHWKTIWENISFNGAATLSYTGSLLASNIFGKVTTLPSSGASIKVLKKDSSNNWVTDFSTSVASTRDFGFYLAPGTTYKIQAVPNSNEVGPVTTGELIAPATGTATLTDITFATPNVSGTLAFGTTKFAGKSVYGYRVDDDSEAFNVVTDANGVYRAFLAPGSYYIYAEQPSYLYNSGGQTCIVPVNSTAVVCDPPVIQKNLSGRVTVSGVGVKVLVDAYKLPSSGDGNYGNNGGDYSIDDGNYALQVSAGEYQISATRIVTTDKGGESYIPLGFTEKCTVLSTPSTCNAALVPNFKVKMTDANGVNLSESSSISFFEPIMESGVVREQFDDIKWNAQNSMSADGISIPNGTHYFVVNNSRNWGFRTDFSTRNFYKLTVVGNQVVSLATMSGEAVSPVDGVFTIKTRVPNLSLRTFNGVTAYTNANVQIISRDGLGATYYRTGSSNKLEFKLPTGVFDLKLRPLGNEDPPMGTGSYVVTVDSQGLVSVAIFNGSPLSASNGVFDISLGIPNITGTMTVNGNSSQGYMEWAKKNPTGDWEWVDNYSEINSNGKFGGTFEPGVYRASGAAYTDSQNKGFISQECIVPTSGSVVCNIAVPADNLKLRIKNSDGVVQTSAYVFMKLMTSTNQGLDFYGGSVNRNTGYFNVGLFDGKYEIRVHEGKGSSSKLFTFDAVNGVVANFYDTVAKVNISLTGDAFELAFQAPNLTGTIKDSAGNPLSMTGKGLDVSIQRLVNSNWNWYKNIWLNEPTYSLGIADAGIYRLFVDPYDFENYSTTASANFYVNNALEVSLSENAGFVPQLNNFNVTLKENNFLFKVLNPIDEKPITWSIVTIFKKINGNETYFGDRYVYSKKESLGGQFLPVGEYRIIVDPINQSSLDQREYLVSVDVNEAVTVTSLGNPLSKVSNRFILYPNKSNVFGQLVDSGGSIVNNQRGWVNIQLQKKTIDGLWNYAGKSAQVNNDGYFGLRVNEVGIYRLAIQPYQKNNVGLTFSSSFEVTTENLGTFSKEFAPLVLNAPNIEITVGTSASSSGLVDAQVSVSRTDISAKKDNLWWNDNTNTPESGVVGFYLPYAGDYQITVRPNSAAATAGATTKTYSVTGTEGLDGKISVVVSANAGAITTNGVTRLLLGVANIKGTVRSPDSSTVVTNTYVVPMRVENGNQYDLWDKYADTDINGNFAITLGEGTYKIRAVAPWNSLIYGDSKIIGEIVVDASGNVTSVPAGKEAMNFTIPLSVPTWTGVIKNPAGTAVVENAQLCLNYRISSNNYSGTCKSSDSQGRFALTLPDGAVFDSNASLQMYSPNNAFPQRSLRGQAAIESFLGAPGADKVLLFPSANVKINVTTNGVAAPDIQVEVSRNNEWIGNQNTNSNGVAEFYSADLTSAMMARAWVQNSASALNAQYVTTKRDFSATEVTSGTTNSVFTGNIALAVPNIKGVVRMPSVNGVQGAATRQAYIHVYDRTSNEWISYTGLSEDGTFALFLKGGCCDPKNYTIVLEPQWDASSTQDLVRREFDVEVTPSNVATITDRATGIAVSSEQITGVTVSTLVLGTPNVKGSVITPTGVKVSNVGVYINGEKEGLGTYTNFNGDFKGSLPNGNYAAEAGIWNNTSGFARSELCKFEIQENKVKTPGNPCVNSDGQLRLALRAPNFTFTLKNNGVPLQNAHVSISIGGFHTWTNPDATGKVSFFIDDALIAAQSQGYGSTTFTPYIYVYPYGNTDGAIEWSCGAGAARPICSQLSDYTIGQPWVEKHLGDIQVLTSNIKIKIVRPTSNESIGEYAYAELIRFDRGSDEWAGWGRTDSQGFAGFYIESSTALASARYKIRITPPWQYRSQFGTKIWDNNLQGYTYDELNNLQLALGLPNLKISVVAPNGSTPSKRGWSYIQEIDANNNATRWVDSVGHDEFGKSAYTLEASKRYRLVAYPGGGGSGAVTTCLLQSDSQTVLSVIAGGCVGGVFNTITEMTLTLARGNVIGTVYSDDGVTPVAGAIIYANVVNATDESKAITSCTLANGTYGITLDPNFQWIVKVFPINKPGAAIALANKNDLAAITPPAIGESVTLNITLARKP